jgi:hypothetical protein
MAIDWRLVTSCGERRGESYPRFPCEFWGHGLILCFWFWSTRGLVFGQLAGAEDSSLEATHKPRYVFELKLVWFWGIFEIMFWVCSPIYRAPGWQVFIRHIVCVDVGIGRKGAEAVSFRI